MPLKSHFFLKYSACIGVLSLLILFSSLLGSSQGVSQSIKQLVTQDSQFLTILWTIRLPRIFAAVMGGGSLALAALLLQAFSHNPLADSSTIGTNSGAGFAITLALIANLHQTLLGSYLTSFLAIIGGISMTSIIYHISLMPNKSIQPTSLILAGISLSSLLSGLMISLVGHIDQFKLDAVINWLGGTITGDRWDILMVISPLLLLLWAIVYQRHQQLNIFALNDHSASALGMDVKKERHIYLILASMLASLSVVLVGNINFVGLLASHSASYLVGYNHKHRIPISLLLGMSILLLADTITRVWLVGLSLPTGLFVSLVGCPYLLYLLLKNKKD